MRANVANLVTVDDASFGIVISVTERFIEITLTGLPDARWYDRLMSQVISNLLFLLVVLR